MKISQILKDSLAGLSLGTSRQIEFSLFFIVSIFYYFFQMSERTTEHLIWIMGNSVRGRPVVFLIIYVIHL